MSEHLAQNEPKKKPSLWRRFASLPLRLRMTAAIGIALFPICLAAAIAQYAIDEHHNNLAQKKLVAQGEAVLLQQTAIFEELRLLLEAISIIPDIRSASDNCAAILRHITIHKPYIANLKVVSPEGENLCSLHADMEATHAVHAKRAGSINKFAIWPRNQIGPSGSSLAELQLVAALPMLTENETANSAIMAGLTFRSFLNMTAKTEQPEGSAIAFLDENGTIIAQNTRDTAVDVWLPRSFSAGIRPNLLSGSFVQKGFDGFSRVYVMNALPGGMFAIYAQTMHAPAIGEMALFYYALIFPLLVWVTASLIAGNAAQRIIANPINRIRKSIRRHIAGDYASRVDESIAAPVEIRALASKFNRLMETIDSRDAELRSSLEHQKALLREINHRVRNNLQVMNSLLNLQGRRAKSAEGISIFKDVQRRLNALGIVHSALYKGDDFRVVDLCALLTDLCRSTESQLSAEWGTPMLTMRCDSPANALPDSALTLAFLVTELISTATSDTAPEGQHATQLDFDLSERPEGGMALTLHVDQPVLHSILKHPDDGRINLFRGLVRQLRGHIDLAEDNCTVTIRLPSLI